MPRTVAILSIRCFIASAQTQAVAEESLAPTFSALRPADAPPARIPETSAGRLLTAWLQAHNQADGPHLEAWLRRSFSAERLDEMDVAKSLAWYVESARMFGVLAEEPYHVVEDEPHRLVVWILGAELDVAANPDPTRVIVVEIDMDPDDQERLARGLGLGSLACELHEDR